MASCSQGEDAEFGDADTIRSETTLAIGDFSDEISLGDSTVATVEDLSSSAHAQALRNKEKRVNDLMKENAELRRHVKRRMQALDTIRRAYIVDVDRLKRSLREKEVEGELATESDVHQEAILEGIPSLDFRPVLKLFAPSGDNLQISPCKQCGGTLEIIRSDDQELLKMRCQIDNLRIELKESDKRLGYYKTFAESYRLKAETSSSEFSELNNMLLREIKLLKGKLVDAGPEVVAKISEERERMESRLRSANRAVSELENFASGLQDQLERANENNAKVAEMEYFLLEKSKEVKAMTFDRDSQASTADELRATVASLREELRQAAASNTMRQLTIQDGDESHRRCTLQEKELECLRDEVEEEEKARDRAADEGLMERREREVGEQEVDSARSTVETIRDDIHSGANARREEQAALEMTQLKALAAKAAAKVKKVERENRTIFKMWKSARALLLEAERTNLSGQRNASCHVVADSGNDFESNETKEFISGILSGTGNRHSLSEGTPLVDGKKEEGVGVPTLLNSIAGDAASQGGGTLSVHPARSLDNISDETAETLDEDPVRSPTSSVPIVAVEKDDERGATGSTDDGDADDVMAVAVAYLEEDCRRLRKEKRELQGYCSTNSSVLGDLGHHFEKAQVDLEKERQGRQETERELEVLRELHSKTTSTLQERSMALHDAQKGTERFMAELESEKQDSSTHKMKLRQMEALTHGLEADLAKANNAIQVTTAAKNEATATAERYAYRAESEGMRAEETISRHFLSYVAANEKVDALALELGKRDNELKRQRKETEEQWERMKEFRQVIDEKDKLKGELVLQHRVNLELQQKNANDQIVIEELKMQVSLLDVMRKEVLRFEADVDRLQRNLSTAKASLELLEKQNEVVSHKLREKDSLARKLWASLVGAMFLVDDWCTGPLLAWRDKDRSLTATVTYKPPSEALAVEEIMKLRRTRPGYSNARTTSSTAASPSLLEGVEGVAASIEDRIEERQPHDITAWLYFRVQVVATKDHNDRVDSARSELQLLDSTCRQRAAHILNLEEELRRLQAMLVALRKDYDGILVVKEGLLKTVSEQKQALVNSNKELGKYEMLKVDHQVEVRRHEKAAKGLREAQNNIKILESNLERALNDVVMAETTAQEADRVRAAAMDEKDAAVREANVTRETMKREKEQAACVRKKLDDLVQENATRLATNKTIATEVGYGDFTEEAGTMTTYLCPELTIRQIIRLPAERGFLPECVGRVYPAYKYAEPCKTRPDSSCDRLWQTVVRSEKRGRRKGEGPTAFCHVFSKQQRATPGAEDRGMGIRSSSRAERCEPCNRQTSLTAKNGALQSSWRSGAQQHRQANEDTFRFGSGASSETLDDSPAWSVELQNISLPRISQP